MIRTLQDCWARARAHPWGGRGEFDRVRTALTLRRLRRALPERRPLDVLEIGFGRGLLLSAFLRAGHRVSGIDPDALQREVPARVRDRTTIYAQSAESVELPEKAFDLVYGVHVVEHLEDPAAVFRACFRSLRPDGRLYLMTPNAESQGLRLFGESWWNLEDPTHIRFFSPRSIGLMLRRAGFPQGTVRTPVWDSQTLEISSLMRLLRLDGEEHGVLASKLTLPMTAALLPFALAARLVWPRLAPSMEVVARKTASA